MTEEPSPHSDRRLLGYVEVDSGSLLVGDPLYMLASVERGLEGLPYESIFVPDGPAQPLAGKPVLLIGRFGGDGTFPVFGEFDEYGELTRVTVEFEGPDDSEERDDG